jgi:hypothetical protein
VGMSYTSPTPTTRKSGIRITCPSD